MPGEETWSARTSSAEAPGLVAGPACNEKPLCGSGKTLAENPQMAQIQSIAQMLSIAKTGFHLRNLQNGRHLWMLGPGPALTTCCRKIGANAPVPAGLCPRESGWPRVETGL